MHYPLQAITGEYQRERLAEEKRQMAAAMAAGAGGSVAGVGRDGRVGGSCLCKTSGAQNTQGPRTGEDNYYLFSFPLEKGGSHFQECSYNIYNS